MVNMTRGGLDHAEQVAERGRGRDAPPAPVHRRDGVVEVEGATAAAGQGAHEAAAVVSSAALFSVTCRQNMVHGMGRVSSRPASHLLVDWVGLTWILSVPLSAQFCLG